MTSNPYADFPAAPPGIAEWEDLLIRFELGPRIAATVLEEIPAERWIDAGKPGAWSPREHLAHLAASEAELEAGLRALQSGEPLGGRAPEPGPGLGPARYRRSTPGCGVVISARCSGAVWTCGDGPRPTRSGEW